MIKAIILNNCTPYQNASIRNCRKINFIFGANGSGKSTISAFLDGSTDPRFNTSTIEWEGVAHEAVYVYNRGFRERNFKQTIPGIFTMGRATIDDINALEQLKDDLEIKKESWEEFVRSYKKQTEEVIPALENQFKEDAWNQILKVYEVNYQKAFEGLRNNKERFVDELKRRIERIPGHEGVVCDKENLLKRAKTLYASKPKHCSSFELDVEPWLEKVEEIRSDPIWNTVISGNADVDIAALIEELGNSSWVDQGRNYIKPGSMVCPFCQQETITEEFKERLESFFDTEYKRRVNKMISLRQEYHDTAENIINAIRDAAQNDSAVAIGKLDTELCFAKQELLRTMYSEHESKMAEKITEPGIKVAFSDSTSTVREIVDLFYVANNTIDAHNKLVDERQTEIERLTDDVWATALDEADLLIKNYQRNIRGMKQGAANIKSKCDAKKAEIDLLEAEIIEKGKNITSVQPTIDEINRSLKSYGFTDFFLFSAQKDRKTAIA